MKLNLYERNLVRYNTPESIAKLYIRGFISKTEYEHILEYFRENQIMCECH